MPNNVPVTMDAETLKGRMETAKEKILVNVGFYSEFPNRVDGIDAIIEAGAIAFKLYLNEQVGGLNTDDDKLLEEAFRAVRARLPIAVHAEDKNMLDRVKEKLKQEGRSDIKAFLEAHSVEAEVKAVKRMLEIARRTKARVHFCHISTKHSLDAIYTAKKEGLPLTCEVTPHHLFLSIDDLNHIGGIALTVPPLRDKDHVDFLWKGLKCGFVDVVSSDHAPHALYEKDVDNVWDVKPGIPGLETSLPLMLTAVNMGLLEITDIVRLMVENPARIFKLKGRGIIEEGFKADLVIIDLKKEYRIDASKFHSKAKFSPFDGKHVKGKPVKTFVNGKLVMDDGEIVAKVRCGEIIHGEGGLEVYC
jgi:dihydroorotase